MLKPIAIARVLLISRERSSARCEVKGIWTSRECPFPSLLLTSFREWLMVWLDEILPRFRRPDRLSNCQQPTHHRFPVPYCETRLSARLWPGEIPPSLYLMRAPAPATFSDRAR